MKLTRRGLFNYEIVDFMVVWDIFGSLDTEMKTISWESKLRLYKAFFFFVLPSTTFHFY